MRYAINFIKNLLPSISDKNIERVLKIASEKSFKKKEIVVVKGEKPQYFYILKNGIARSYIVDKNGKEHTKNLYLPPSTCSSLSALIEETESDTIIDCITDCEFVEFDFYSFRKLTEGSLELNKLYLKGLENAFLRNNERLNNLTLLDSTEHYLKLKEEIPEIEDLIPQYHIASYLNITPVQLSRIRKKISLETV